MKASLYSRAHIEAAKILFPSLASSNVWLNSQWTNDELAAVKSFELQKFIHEPSLDSYPFRRELLNNFRLIFNDYEIVSSFLKKNKQYKTFLSLGCGLGLKELILAMKYPNILFSAIDTDPSVEGLNSVANELGIKNIKFKRIDIDKIDSKKYDIVYSFAVIYCITDSQLEGYFSLIEKITNVGGSALIGCSANFNLLSKFIRLIQYFIPYLRPVGVKKTGWIRDVGHIKKYINNKFFIKKILYFGNFKKNIRDKIFKPNYFFILRKN